MSTQDRLSPFEARLLGELKRAVATRAEAGSNVTARRNRRPRLVVAGGVAAVVAAGIAAGVPFLGGGGTQAYAVTKNGDGSVTVEVSSLKDAAGLERQLRDAGIPAAVQYIPPGKACKEPTFVPATGDPSQTRMEMSDSGALRFTLDRRDMPAGATLVIFTQQLELPKEGGTVGASSIGVALAKGAVAPCELVDGPAGVPPMPVEAGAGGGSALQVGPGTGAEPSFQEAREGQVSG